jgi:ribosomal-protein-alanine N-acetyltransferase
MRQCKRNTERPSMTSPLPDRLETPRLVLREPAAADARGLFEAYTQDAQVARFMMWRPHRELSDAEAFVAWCMQSWAGGQRRPFIVARRDDEARPIGVLEARFQGTTIDVGFVLARPHWGDGLMPEAVTTLVGEALADPGVFRVQATCDVENGASVRTLEKAGFTREGRLERFAVHPNIGPEPRACFMFARCR